MKKGLEGYDSYAYKLMCVMDICLDIDPNYRTYFEASEHMFNNLKSKLIRFEEYDDNCTEVCDWYGQLVKFLKDEEKRDDLVHKIVTLRNDWSQEEMIESGYNNTGHMVSHLSRMPVKRLEEILSITEKIEDKKIIEEYS